MSINSIKPGVTIALLVCLGLTTTSHAQEIKADSQISEVTVYPDSALVTRLTTIQLQAGEQSVSFEGIIPQLDENSLTVSGSGTADVKLFGASIQKEYLKESANERIRELTRTLEEIQDQISHEESQLRILQDEKEYLDSIKLFSGQQIPKDLVTKIP